MQIRRNISIKIEIWEKSLKKAKELGFSLSAIITMLLSKWLKKKQENRMTPFKKLIKQINSSYNKKQLVILKEHKENIKLMEKETN